MRSYKIVDSNSKQLEVIPGDKKHAADLFTGISEDEWSRLLEAFSETKRPLFLPDPREIREVVDAPTTDAPDPMGALFDSAMALRSHLKLLAVKSNLRIICCLHNPSGSPCGGLMDIAVDRNGAFYQCRLDPLLHRIPV
jgi:hypothetical protein